MNQLITVVIPVYNAEKYISACVESVLNQSYTDFELLLINDGSTDNSLNIINGFSDNRIIVINKDNSGVSNCRNLGINEAKGNYIYFLDSDDWIEPTLLERVNESINVLKPDLIIFGYYINQYNKSDFLVARQEKILKKKDFYKNSKEFDYNIFSFLGYIWNKAYKIKFLKDNDIYFKPNLHLYEDVCFNLVVFPITTNIEIIEECLYNYSNRENISLVKSFNPETLEFVLTTNNAIIDFFDHCEIGIHSKNKLVAYNLMIGLKHTLNALFKYNYQSYKINQVQFIKDLLNNEVVRKFIGYYEASCLRDKTYKFFILYKFAFGLYFLLKIKK